MSTSDLTLYTDSSPNGFKITIALEEMGLPYALRHVHIDDGEHQQPDFLALNPYGRIPVLVITPPASPCSNPRRSCCTSRTRAAASSVKRPKRAGPASPG